MRVLVISTHFPPERRGGYELQCRGFVDHLRRHGHRVQVLTGTDLPRFPATPARTSLAAAWRAERRAAAVLRARLRAFSPDAVAFWRLGELSMSLVQRVREAGIPAVGMVCDPWMVDGPARDPWARRHGMPAPAGAARWLFVSAALLRQVRAAGLDPGPAEVVPWGVELSRLPLAAPRPPAGRLLYAGRLSPLKGVDLALRALARLPGARLEVLGGGEAGYEQELRALAGALGIADRVAFRGPRSRAEVANAYARADAVLFPVRWEEPFGSVPLEAMARGTPVVATATGGSAEFLLHERTALIVPPEDPEAIAAAVTRLEADPALRGRLRAAGRRMAERYPAERSHERVRLVLEEAAAAGRVPAAARRTSRSRSAWRSNENSARTASARAAAAPVAASARSEPASSSASS